MSAKILVVDDEEDIRDILSYHLKKEGFEVATAVNGVDGIEVAKSFSPDLIILDVMMPEMDGIECCIELRKIPNLSNVTISFLSARGEDYSQIAGLEAGADDYITKPIKPRLLVTKVNALLRRSEAPTVIENKTEGIHIDRQRYVVIVDGDEITLPKKEFELMGLLLSKPGVVFTREDILSEVWGSDIIVGDRTIDVHIRKLREKIGKQYIQTIKGVGYKFMSQT